MRWPSKLLPQRRCDQSPNGTAAQAPDGFTFCASAAPTGAATAAPLTNKDLSASRLLLFIGGSLSNVRDGNRCQPVVQSSRRRTPTASVLRLRQVRFGRVIGIVIVGPQIRKLAGNDIDDFHIDRVEDSADAALVGGELGGRYDLLDWPER